MATICLFTPIINFMFSLKIFSYGEYFQRNYLKLFILLNYSISFGYSNTIRIVFPERVITRYSVRTDLFFEYIFGIRFVTKFTIRWNSASCLHGGWKPFLKKTIFSWNKTKSSTDAIAWRPDIFKISASTYLKPTTSKIILSKINDHIFSSRTLR